MPQARGSQSAYNIYDETTYGADPGSPSADKLYLKSCGLSSAQNKIESETLTGVRTQSRPTAGNIDASGPLVMELGAESIGKLLKHALGQVATTGASPYVHTITLGALPVGFTFEKDYGSNISGSGRFEKFNGCRISSMDVDIPSEGNVLVTFNAQGANSSLQSAALDGTPTDSSHTTFSVASLGTIEEGGSTIATIKAMKFSLNNDLDTDGYVLGAAGVRAELAEGFAMVTGEITAVFDSAALLPKAINSAATSH